MGKDTLKNYVLALADAARSLSEPARLAVLAASRTPTFCPKRSAVGRPPRTSRRR